MTWQPIETAPKDGALILIYDDVFKFVVACWRQHYTYIDKGYWGNAYDEGSCRRYLPNVWMPLPDPPEEG